MLGMLFAPAIMDRLRFAVKLALVGLLFITPLTALVVYIYGKLAAELQLTQTERVGVQHMMPVCFGGDRADRTASSSARSGSADVLDAEYRL